jgi:hypothetical protein
LDDQDAQQHEAKVRLQQLEQSYTEKLSEQRERSAEELGRIHLKLQTVLGKKNNTIEQLRTSLEEANKRLAAHEQDMRRHKLELFEQMKW